MKEMPVVRLAIIDSNILTCIGLQRLLCDMLPMAEIVTFASFGSLERLDSGNFFHYFVSSRIYFEHAPFFRKYPKKSIVLVNGDLNINGVHTLNVCQSEAALVRDIMKLQQFAHKNAIIVRNTQVRESILLSPREIEVAVLLCKGNINKEIADALNVSITTIISHRKNIMNKLQARSIADVIIYCVVNGIVSLEELQS